YHDIFHNAFIEVKHIFNQFVFGHIQSTALPTLVEQVLQFFRRVVRFTHIDLEPHQPEQQVSKTVQHPDNGPEDQVEKPQGQRDTHCGTHGPLDSYRLGCQFTEYDMQDRNDGERKHMAKILGNCSC